MVTHDYDWKTLSAGCATLCRESRANYDWLLLTLETVHGPDVMKQVRLTVTDGAPSIIDAVDASIKENRLGGKRGLCFWHAFHQPAMKLTSTLKKNSKDANFYHRVTVSMQ